MTESCITPGCGEAKLKPKHRCVECLEQRLPIDKQVELALARAAAFTGEPPTRALNATMQAEHGRKWCRGCCTWRRLDVVGVQRFDMAPGQSRCRPCARVSRTRLGFGLSEEQQATMSTTCDACGGSQRIKSLATDHDHRCCPGGTSCGKCVLGRLCQRCNKEVLGAVHDSTGTLAALLAYRAAPPLRGTVAFHECVSCDTPSARSKTRTAIVFNGVTAWLCQHHFTGMLSALTLAGEQPNVLIGT